MIVYSLIKELELASLKVDNLKGWKPLEGRDPLKTGGIENMWEPLLLEIPYKSTVWVCIVVC